MWGWVGVGEGSSAGHPFARRAFSGLSSNKMALITSDCVCAAMLVMFGTLLASPRPRPSPRAGRASCVPRDGKVWEL